MTHPTRIPILKRAIADLRRGETNPQLRLGILRDSVYEALILIIEREFKWSLVDEQNRVNLDNAIESALERSKEEADL